MLSISVAAIIWLVSLRTLSTALDPTLEGTWKYWKATHGKDYPQEEESFRRIIWKENCQMIPDHNKEADLGKYTYWLGMNHFGDLTNEELDERLHCLLPDFNNVTEGIKFKSSEDPDLPDHIDWRTKGGVPEVKDQKLECRYNFEESITRCNSFGQIIGGDKKEIQEAVAKIGPVSVGIDAESNNSASISQTFHQK